MAVPNQRIIYVKRASNNSKKDYFKIGNKQLKKAASDLKGNAFKLYIYLADNSDGFRLELSSKDFINWSNTSNSTYDRAFAELKEKDYLIQSAEHKNLYLFQEESNSYDERHQDDKIILEENKTIEELFGLK